MGRILSDRESGIGVGSFTLGGLLLFFGAYYAVENANKPWINEGLFMAFFILPVILMSFFLLGLGLHLIVKSACRRQ